MIPIQELLFAIDTKANSLANLKGKYIPDETKIEVLNLSQIKLVLKKVDANNNYQMGMDSFTKRAKDLEVLQVPYEKLSLTATKDLLNSYTAPLSGLANQLLVPVNAYVTATKGNCKGRILDIIVDMRHSDVRQLLKSPHYKPMFNYQETVSSISSGIVSVYSDGTFSIEDLYISYLRYPIAMDVIGYVHLDNSASTNEDCELEYYLMNELVDLAVEEIADSIKDQSQSQLSRTRTRENE